MKKLLPLLLIFIFSCSKEVNNESDDKGGGNDNNPVLKYPVSKMDDYSGINKKTSWYRTNKSFDQLFEIRGSRFPGFVKTDTGYEPYVHGSFSNDKEYWWAERGGYIYADLNQDGTKDVFQYYFKGPWPTNEKGLHFYSDDGLGTYNLQAGLTQVRKNVLSDFDNNGKEEIMLISSGYDAYPFPGDSLAFFDVSSKKYHYLSSDIGYFHGGATGDINLDGNEDIVAYSGGSAIINSHPTCYINNGNYNFQLNNSVFKNFEPDEYNFYTVELFDLNKDGQIDLFLGGPGNQGGKNELFYIQNQNGTFDIKSRISIMNEDGLEPMDIAFFDFDEDGKKEILVLNNKNGYNGFALRLYKFDGTNSNEISKDYFDTTDHSGPSEWIKWIRIFDYDKDGDLDIVGDGLFGGLDPDGAHDVNENYIYWKNDSGAFKYTRK